MEKIKMLTEQSFKKVIIRKNGSKRVQTINEEPSMTDAQYTEDTDVNHIMRRYQKTGLITHISQKQGVYADVSDIPDLIQANQIAKDAMDAFMRLPSEVRLKFKNNPEEMINFLKNPQNHKEAVTLGLLVDKTPPAKNDNSNDEKKPGKQSTKKSPSPADEVSE